MDSQFLLVMLAVAYGFSLIFLTDRIFEHLRPVRQVVNRDHVLTPFKRHMLRLSGAVIVIIGQLWLFFYTQ